VADAGEVVPADRGRSLDLVGQRQQALGVDGELLAVALVGGIAEADDVAELGAGGRPQLAGLVAVFGADRQADIVGGKRVLERARGLEVPLGQLGTGGVVDFRRQGGVQAGEFRPAFSPMRQKVPGGSAA
jgi:hypothetical protein